MRKSQFSTSLGEPILSYKFADTVVSFYRKTCVSGFGVYDGSGLDFVESNSTDFLGVRNDSSNYFLVLPGSAIRWVSQDRVVKYPVIVPPYRDSFDEVFEIRVNCVEKDRGFLSGYSVDEAYVVPFSLRFRVGFLDQHAVWDNVRGLIRRLLDVVHSLVDVPDIFGEFFGYRESLVDSVRKFLSVLYDQRYLRDLDLLNDLIEKLSNLVFSLEFNLGRFSRSGFGEEDEERFFVVNRWLGIISDMCRVMASRIGSDNVNIRGIYSDLFGLLIPNRPKELGLIDLIRVKLFLERVSDIISEFTGLGDRVSDEFPLVEMYRGIHYDLAEKATKLVRDHQRFLIEVHRLAESFISHPVIKEKEEHFILDWRDGVGLIYARLMSILSSLKDSVEKLEKKLKEGATAVDNYVLDPSLFGLKLPNDVNALSVWKNDKLIYYERFPCYMSSKLWRHLFTSLFIDGIVGSKWAIEDNAIGMVNEMFSEAFNGGYPINLKGRVFYNNNWFGYKILWGRKIVYEFYVRREGELDYGRILRGI